MSPHEDRRIGLTQLVDTDGDSFDISTIRLLVEHQGLTGPPMGFQTTVFGPENSGHDGFSDWYTTKEDAVQGHESCVSVLTRLLRKPTRVDIAAKDECAFYGCDE